MAAEKYNVTICQGSVFELSFEYLDAAGFGINLSNALVRMQIRTPSRTDDPEVLSLESGVITPLGSTITIVNPIVQSAVPATEFTAPNIAKAASATFITTVEIVTARDDEGVPTQLGTEQRNVVNVGDRVVISGSTSNDGADWRIASVVAPDEITLTRLGSDVVTEPALGTIEVSRYGRFEILITAEESDAFDFTTGEYDIEIVEDIALPSQPIRILQGKVKLDKQVTR